MATVLSPTKYKQGLRDGAQSKLHPGIQCTAIPLNNAHMYMREWRACLVLVSYSHEMVGKPHPFTAPRSATGLWATKPSNAAIYCSGCLVRDSRTCTNKQTPPLNLSRKAVTPTTEAYIWEEIPPGHCTKSTVQLVTAQQQHNQYGTNMVNDSNRTIKMMVENDSTINTDIVCTHDQPSCPKRRCHGCGP